LGYYNSPNGYYYYGLWDYLGVNYVGDGYDITTGNISELDGQAGTFVDGWTCSYPYQEMNGADPGPDNFVDEFAPTGSGAYTLFECQNGIGRVIATDRGGYLVITSATVFSFMGEGTKHPGALLNDLMDEILAFFEDGSSTTNIQPMSIGTVKALYH